MQRKPDETSPRERKAPVAPPGVAWQSRLNPHIDAVWAWRKDGKTLEEIVQLLKLEKGVTVALSTLHTFIESRKRRAAKLALPDLHAKPSPAPVTPAPKGTTKAQEPAPAAAPLPAPGPAPKPRTFDPQTDNNGFPLTGRSEVIGRDHAGRPLTRNRPFKGQV